MEFTVFGIIVLPIVFFSAAFFLFFLFRSGMLGGYAVRSMWRTVAGSVVAGVAVGSVAGATLAFLLPTYYYVRGNTSEQCCSRFVLNGNLLNEAGKSFVVNETSEAFCLVAKIYGDVRLEEGEKAVTIVKPGKMQVQHVVNNFFKSFPLTESDDDNGIILRYIIEPRHVKRELEKKVTFEYDSND